MLGTLVSGAMVFANQAASASESPAHVDLTAPHPQPPYPDSAQAVGEAGTVLLDVYVRPSGRAGKVRVSQSSGFEDLDTAAVQGVLNWRYVPALRGGDPVSDWTSVKIVFQLPQTAAPASN